MVSRLIKNSLLNLAESEYTQNFNISSKAYQKHKNAHL